MRMDGNTATLKIANEKYSGNLLPHKSAADASLARLNVHGLLQPEGEQRFGWKHDLLVAGHCASGCSSTTTRERADGGTVGATC
jgi:hypothetical protein